MKILIKKYIRYLILLLIPCIFLPECSPDKEFRFTFNRKDGETYIQKLSISRERHIGPTSIQMDDTLSETRVTCKKTEDGWKIEARPINRIMFRNGKEEKSPLLDLLSEFVITYKVDKNGSIKDVLGYDKVLKAIDTRYPSEIAEDLSSSLDVNILKQREITEWEGRIGNYLNREFSIGDVWEFESLYTLPNGIKLNYRVKTLFKELVQYKNVRCVLVEQTYDSTGKGMTDLANDFAESVPTVKGDNNQSLKADKISSSIKGKVTRIIDPSTMNIYREESERVIDMEMAMPGAGPIPVKMVETRTYDYEY